MRTLVSTAVIMRARRLAPQLGHDVGGAAAYAVPTHAGQDRMVLDHFGCHQAPIFCRELQDRAWNDP